MHRVYAAVDIGTLSNTFTSFGTFGDLVSMIVKNALTLAGIICFVILVLGGFRVIMAAGSGESKQMEGGKNAITGAVIGLIIVVFGVWIVQIIGTITGINILNPGQ
jgi:VIT1/CCC1 family predicted Fe2+/Mn2+ transporter